MTNSSYRGIVDTDETLQVTLTTTTFLDSIEKQVIHLSYISILEIHSAELIYCLVAQRNRNSCRLPECQNKSLKD